MKKAVRLLFLFLVCYTTGYAQNYWKLTILDSSTDKAVEFATLSINKSKYFSTDGAGTFLVPKRHLSIGDSIIISSLTYTSHAFEIKSLEGFPASIKLDPAVYHLQQVTVLSSKVKTVELGNKTKLTVNKFLPDFGHSFAFYISNQSKRTGIVKNVKFKITNSLSGQKEPFKVRILSRPTMESILPGSELIGDEIVAHNPKSQKWVEVDLLRYNLAMPQNGFFVVFEVLPRSYYESRTFKKYGRSFNQLPAIALSGIDKEGRFYTLSKSPLSQKWHEMKDLNVMIRAELIVD